MLNRRLKEWAVIGIAAIQGLILCNSLAWAEEAQGSVTDYSSLQKPSNSVGGVGFLLNFSQRYYQEVNASLQDNSYFIFRYYLSSPFESFDKRQFIYENPTQANDIALRALHNAIRRSIEDNELVENLRDHINAMTSIKMVIGSGGSKLHGPTFSQFGLRGQTPQNESDYKMAITSGITFADDFRLGLSVTVAYLGVVSKLRYYPTSQNEIDYTAERPLNSFSKVGMTYRRSDNRTAVLTSFSLVF